MTMRLTASTLSMLFLGLAGCTVGPEFERPDPPAAPTLVDGDTDAIVAAGQTLALGADPEARWWQPFGSPELDAAVQAALDGNRSLASAQASLARARSTLAAVRGERAPQVDLDASAGRQRYGAASGFSDGDAFDYYSVGPSVSYLFDYAGLRRRGEEQQQALAEQQAWALRAAQLDVSGQVVGQAIAIAAARAELATLDALIDEDQRNLEFVEAAYDAGSVSRVDVLAARTQLAGDRTLMPPLRQALDTARHALAILHGQSPALATQQDFALERWQLPSTLPVSLPSELARRRPDILAAEARLHAATAAVGVADAQRYPRITLAAGASFQSNTPGDLFDTSNAAWNFGAGLTAPLFDGGTLQARSQAARDALAAAAADYQHTVLTAFGQVADALSALQHDAQMLDAQQSAVDVSQDNLALTRESYEAGHVGILQVLDAERAANQARIGLVRAQAQRFRDTAQLYLALGGGSFDAPPSIAAADDPDVGLDSAVQGAPPNGP